jgi:hypothetical protein
MQYTALPSYSSWQRDSNVTFAIRKNDIVLDRIDNLVEHYWSSEDLSKRLIFLCHIFVTLDYWLKMYKTSCRMEKGREPAVRAQRADATAEIPALGDGNEAGAVALQPRQIVGRRPRHAELPCDCRARQRQQHLPGVPRQRLVRPLQHHVSRAGGQHDRVGVGAHHAPPLS